MKPVVYHYSKIGTYGMISPKGVFMDKDELKKEKERLMHDHGMTPSRANEYVRGVSAFPFTLTKHEVLALRKNDFTAWGRKNDRLFQYTLSLEEDRDKIENISVVSSIEEQTFNLEWERYVRTEGDFMHNKAKFQKARSKFFAINGVPDNSPLDDYLYTYQLTENEFRESITRNIEYGSKAQYASYIPHVEALLYEGQSLKIQNVTRIL